MKVTEQIDALRALGVNYIKKLIVPRLMAALLVFPLVTILADGMGLLGGMLIAVFDRNVDAYLYWNTIAYWVVLKDFLTGLGKSFVFGGARHPDRLLQRPGHRGGHRGARPLHHRDGGAGGHGRDHLGLLHHAALPLHVLVSPAHDAAAPAQPLVEVRKVWKSFGEQPGPARREPGPAQGDDPRGDGRQRPAARPCSCASPPASRRPDAGEVHLFGTRIDRMSEEAMLPLRRRTGFVFQGAALFDSLSVFENVAFPLREHTRLSLGEITDRVHHFLDLVGLPDTDDLLPAELSGGMRKRVGIARALIVEPEVVFFDEPTAGLDPTNAQLVAELIAQLRTGVCDTAIVVTHDVEFAELVADQMAILMQGQFADQGTPAEIHRSANPDVRRFLAGELREI